MHECLDAEGQKEQANAKTLHPEAVSANTCVLAIQTTLILNLKNVFFKMLCSRWFMHTMYSMD